MTTIENDGTDRWKTALSTDAHALVYVDRKLRSLREGDAAVVDAVLMGAAAIPVLREILFEADRTGIFEPRRRAIQALAALKAASVLKEFIGGWKRATDPAERFGDEAVLGTAARALAATLDDEAYPILVAVARRYPVPGVIEALGYYSRAESIPILVAALADDLGRPPAEQAFRMLGQAALPALVETASRPVAKVSERESPSSIRQRRSALRLILELGATRDTWERLHNLVQDLDDEIATLACRIGLVAAADTEGRECASRLVALLTRVAWPLNQEIEDCLSDNFTIARELIDRTACGSINDGINDVGRARFIRSLRRVKASGSAKLYPRN
jgi:hypothetical protein